MKCKHHKIGAIATHAFSGPVGHDENRAAHGNVCDTEECQICGARRSVNVNQCHREEGAWGPTSAERAVDASRLEARAAEIRAAVAGATITLRRDEETCDVTIDREGFLIVENSRVRGEEIAAAAPAFVAAAIGLREATRVAADAGADV